MASQVVIVDTGDWGGSLGPVSSHPTSSVESRMIKNVQGTPATLPCQ